MKYFLFLSLAVFLAWSQASGQTGGAGKPRVKRTGRSAKTSKPITGTVTADAAPPVKTVERAKAEPAPEPPPPFPPAPKNERPSSDTMKDVSIGKWGAASLTLPDDLTTDNEASDVKANGKVSWTTFARYWKQPRIYYPSALEVDLTINSYNNDFPEVVPDLRPDLATPENLNLVNLLADVKRKNQADSPVKEAKMMKIGGVEGTFFLAEFPTEKDSLRMGWLAYRYYKGKAQQISLSITARRNELAKALKIIESLKFEAEDR